MQVTDEMVRVAHAEYHKVLGDKNRSDPMRAALTVALAAMWRPIEEAPKDGTDVWVINPKWLMPCPAHFTSREYLTREYGDPDHMEEGWYPSYGFLFDLPETTIDPTHFMPLPSPPKAEG